MREEGYITDKNNSCEYIRLAVKSDICAIREIWRNIFTADEDYLDIIFNDLFPLLDAYVYTIDEEIVSVAFAIPIALVQRNIKDSTHQKEKHYYGRYLYGVATTDRARGRGLSRRVVKHIKECCTAAGEDFIITRPAEESLFPFYRAQGFNLPLYRQETTVYLIQPVESSKLYEASTDATDYNSDISANELYNLRRKLSQNLFVWSAPILECILKLFKVEKSKIRHFPESEKYFIASCYTQESGTNTIQFPNSVHSCQNPEPQENQRRLIIQENNFTSLKELLSHLHKMEISNTHPYATEFDKIGLIEIIQPVKFSTERVHIDFDHKTTEERVSEFALCMPLSGKITDELIQNSFFNFTME